MTERYRGRFAPSPTGPLHFGSLVAAVASYLQARHQDGEWWLRIEDIDPPREVTGASRDIIRALTKFGFEWDNEIVYQSQRNAIYRDALQELQAKGHLFPCACSRKDIAKQAPDGVYPGTCRAGLPGGRHARSWRVRTDERIIEFSDTIQGDIRCELAPEVGDFVLKRADGLFAYNLAVAVDDALQGMSEVVRGADLLGCTAQQIYLHQLLGYHSPRYIHHPVVLNSQGQKLSKQNQAVPVDARQPVLLIWQALSFLGQAPPADLRHSSLAEIWQWATDHWRLAAISRTTGQQVEEIGQMSDN